MTDPLHGIEEDVPFDNAVADKLIAFCNSTATTVEGQYGSRSSWVSTAMKDFQGYFSTLFQDNANTAHADATELVARLREVATGATRLKEEAAKEQKRRETARKWKQEQDDRNAFEKGWDSVFGEDKPPVGPPAEPVNVPVSPPRTAPRQTPPPGSGGGGGGTTSARPADLHTFATNSNGANQTLHGKPATLKADLSSFASACRWGTLNADGVAVGFDKWLQANDEDVKWANVVGDAFAKAGSEGAVSTLQNSAIAATLASHGVSAVRQDLTIAGPVAIGHPPTTGYAVDPVNTSTGNFVETESDIAFAEACDSLEFTRTYNSVASALGELPGAFGEGWASWTETGLRFDDEVARMVLPDGRQVEFPRLGAGWDRAIGESLWLAAEGEEFVASDNTGGRWRFARTGRLVSRSSGAGSTVTLTWEEQRLVRLAHERGRWIDLVWGEPVPGGPGRVVGLVASDGRRLQFGYDTEGRLVSATGPLGTRAYRWDDASGLLASVTAADGVVEVDNIYDAHGRVVQQRTAHGRTVRFVYLPGRVTVVSDEDGTRSNTYIADERGRLVGVVDSDEHRQSMAYDKHSNLVMVTERDGSSIIREYDERGRLVRTVQPNGADIEQAWDDHDRLATVSVVAQDGEAPCVTRLEYADPADRNPSLIVDPEGGRTQMVWEQGLLTRVTDPTGVVVTFDFDDHGDLVGTTDAAGNTARLERDTTGRVVAAVTPSGSTTRFSYDERTGLLASRTAPDGAVRRFEYAASGKLAAVIDPLGGRTELEYGPSGDNTRTIDPLGRAITRRFDDLGNVAGFELPDGSTWEFEHDSMSRLRSITDASGATSRFDYDRVGEVTAATDAGGERREVVADRAAGTAEMTEGGMSAGIRLDRLGRLVASEHPDGSTVLTRYDRCGRPVEFVDGEGGVTVVERDRAGRAETVTRADGSVISYEYDACGRASVVIDPLGNRTTVTYDVDGRVVAETSATGDVATSEYDACGRIVKRRIPGVGTSTWDYDACGRAIRVRDPRFGRRKLRYDAAGQLVEAINGNGGSTRWDYDANGRAVAITDPEGGVTRREFDAMNHVVAETDPLGRTTRGGYDANGHQVWQTSPDGERTEWTYDANGQVASVSVDGRLIAAISHDHRGRRSVIRDFSQSGHESEHVLSYDRRGRLVSRTRDGRGLSWTYDALGRRTSRTGPDGATTRYEHDAAGRLTAVDHPLLGRATFAHDAAGRVVSAEAGGVRQDWTFNDGFATAYAVTDGERTARTVIDRDALGRVVSLNRDGEHTTFGYDEACQLIESRTSGADGTRVSRWRYDTGGRLVAESHDGVAREFGYDAAGQLVSAGLGDGSTLTYSYDQQGRRTEVVRSDGTAREFGWATTGWLASVTDRAADGERREVTTSVDALGELSRIDDAEVFFDTASGRPAVAQVGLSEIVTTGLTTGIAGGSEQTWSTPGWRGIRTDEADDPWGSAPSVAGVGPAGEVGFAGLEWLGARVYDPGARGFLSADPLDPVIGAGWSGNPYSYAGNDPLHASDPTGLRPATDADLQAYADAHSGTGFGKWMKNNWEYVAGGAMVLAGGVLIATGVGGPAGMMLISAGADTIIQKATTGKVNWGQVAISGAMGAWGGGGIAARLGAKTVLQKAIVGGMVSGGAGGGLSSAYGYMTGPGPHNVSGFLQSTGTGMGVGMVTGGAGGAASHGIQTAVMRHALNGAPVTPLDDVGTRARSLLGEPGDTVVLGRQPDTAVAKDWPGHTVLDTPDWSPELNHEWVQGAIDYQRPVYIASPIEGNMVQTAGEYAGQPTIFAGELDQLRDAGYQRVGDYMMPPK